MNKSGLWIGDDSGLYCCFYDHHPKESGKQLRRVSFCLAKKKVILVESIHWMMSSSPIKIGPSNKQWIVKHEDQFGACKWCINWLCQSHQRSNMSDMCAAWERFINHCVLCFLIFRLWPVWTQNVGWLSLHIVQFFDCQGQGNGQSLPQQTSQRTSTACRINMDRAPDSRGGQVMVSHVALSQRFIQISGSKSTRTRIPEESNLRI